MIHYFYVYFSAYSSVVENTAFLGEISLRLPDITNSLLHVNSKWFQTAAWAVQFSEASNVFVGVDAKLLHLVCM